MFLVGRKKKFDKSTAERSSEITCDTVGTSVS